MSTDELELLRELRGDLPPADPAVLVRGRAALLSEAHRTPERRVRPGLARPLRLPGLVGRRRPVVGASRVAGGSLVTRMSFRLAVAGGLALAVTAGLFAAQALRSGTSTPNPEATGILDRAALAASDQPNLAARPDQFVFVESVTAYANGNASVDGANGGMTWTVPAPTLRRIWLSADGTGDGLLRQRPQASAGDWAEDMLPGCRNGQQAVITKGGKPVGDSHQACTPTPAYLANLPTTADAMYTYLYRHSNGGNPPDQQAFVTVGDLIREAYLPPASLSALFTAGGRIPGASVVHDAVDASGRHGIAVSRTFNGLRNDLIFDPTTYAFLGEREVVTKDQDGLKKGTVFGSSALLRVAVVDRPGQLP